MTHDKDFKTVVRARAQRTGETYAEARRHVAKGRSPGPKITRAMPDLRSKDMDACKAFYGRLIGFDLSMEQNDFLLFSSPSDPNVQVSINGDANGLPPGFIVDVGTAQRVTEIHDAAVAQSLRIVEPLGDKPWDIRRFSLLDPSGARVTVLAHLPRAER